ncbi:CaiB/BaiF CoA-transferase family protein [soil metagenome]
MAEHAPDPSPSSSPESPASSPPPSHASSPSETRAPSPFASTAPHEAPGGLPLEGIRVVALEHAVAAPLCSRHLADLGALVTKVERPDGGDFARHYDDAVNGLSANFAWLNHGKRSVALDLRSEAGREALEGLLSTADVFVHNLGPGAVERLGFGAEPLAERYPRLVWCSISGYGREGPYQARKGFDLLLQGETGVLAVTGSPEEPAKVGVALGDTAAGIYAAASILAVLLERERTGRGRRVDIALFDVLAEWMSYPLLMARSGRPFARAGARHARIVPYGPYRCGDGGLLNLAVQNEGQWRRLCAALGHAEWADDPAWQRPEGRLADRARLEATIEGALSEMTREEARDRLEAADVPVGDVNDLADVVSHPQLVERDRWLECDSEMGPVRVLDHPFGISGLPRRRRRIPALGEDDEDLAPQG